MPYGAPELKAVARKHMSRATVAGCGLWAVIFVLTTVAAAWLAPDAVKVLVPIQISHRIEPPLSLLERVEVPPMPQARPAPMPKVGVPVPVPEIKDVPPAVPIDLPSVKDDGPPNTGQGTGEQPIEIARGDDPLPGINDPQPYVEEYPVAITRVKPEYPTIAREAGIEGLVKVRALVGRDGRVVDAIVHPMFSIPMLDQAAVEAVRKWVFKPAFANNRPVAVWVAVDVRFRLYGGE
jgi:protein TonB